MLDRNIIIYIFTVYQRRVKESRHIVTHVFLLRRFLFFIDAFRSKLCGRRLSMEADRSADAIIADQFIFMASL